MGGSVQLPGEAAAKQLDNSKGFALGWTSVISSRMVNTFRYGFTRSGHESATVQSAPYVAFRAIDTLHSTAKGVSRIIPVNQFGDDAAWTLGKHDLKFGGVMRTVHNKSNNYANSFAQGSTPYSYLAGTGGALRPADLDPTFSTSYRGAAVNLLGPVGFATITYNYKLDGSILPQGTPVARQYNQNQYELYINDNYRFRKNLTVNLGLRYTLSPTISEANGYLVSPTLNLHDWWVNRQALADQGKSQALAGNVSFVLGSSANALPLYPTQKKNFSPRIALAYSPEATSKLGKIGRAHV